MNKEDLYTRAGVGCFFLSFGLCVLLLAAAKCLPEILALLQEALR